MGKKRIGFLAVIVILMLSGCGTKKYRQVPVVPETVAEEEEREPEGQEPRIGQNGQADQGNRTDQHDQADRSGQTDRNGQVEIWIEGDETHTEPQIVIDLPEKADKDMEEMETQREITLLFAGDVLLSNHVLQAYDKAGGIHGVLDAGYLHAIEQADFFMVNQEFPFSSRGTQAPDKQFTFRLEPERVELFKQIGIDGVTLANNHALDYGQDALLDSCDVLDGAGILHTGAGKNLNEAKQPVIAEIDGKKIAVIGATRVIPVSDWAAGSGHAGMLATYDPSVLLEEIASLKQENDYVIVYVHWGIERDEMPQEYQRKLGHQYIDAGADLVIGAHPHVLQGIEYYQGKPIVYSLGNFIFGSSIPRTMLLKVIWKTGEAEEVKLRLIPGTSGAGYTHMITDSEKQKEFFQYMEGISFGVSYLDDGTVVRQQE